MCPNTEDSSGICSKRSGVRFDYAHDCTLYHNGTKYPYKTKNMSLSGTLVSAQNFTPAPVKLGDMCGISLCADPEVSHGEAGKVTRVSHSDISLQFLGFGCSTVAWK
jgi:hypothetical protein